MKKNIAINIFMLTLSFLLFTVLMIVWVCKEIPDENDIYNIFYLGVSLYFGGILSVILLNIDYRIVIPKLKEKLKSLMKQLFNPEFPTIKYAESLIEIGDTIRVDWSHNNYQTDVYVTNIQIKRDNFNRLTIEITGNVLMDIDRTNIKDYSRKNHEITFSEPDFLFIGCVDDKENLIIN